MAATGEASTTEADSATEEAAVSVVAEDMAEMADIEGETAEDEEDEHRTEG